MLWDILRMKVLLGFRGRFVALGYFWRLGVGMSASGLSKYFILKNDEDALAYFLILPILQNKINLKKSHFLSIYSCQFDYYSSKSETHEI